MSGKLANVASVCDRMNRMTTRLIRAGVLTKPDLLPAGSSDTPLYKVLNRMELKFGHGYFVVKNPDQLMLNNHLTHKDAREQEHQFLNERLSDVMPVTARYYEYVYSTCLSHVLESTGVSKKT